MIYKVKSFLELHEQLLEKGLYARDGRRVVKSGLCGLDLELDGSSVLSMALILMHWQLTPMSYIDIRNMIKRGLDTSHLESDYVKLNDDGVDVRYWGSESLDPCLGIYTPLRQNIVLLLAALNNEL